MKLHKITAGVALTALMMGVTAGPALADKGGHGQGGAHRISQSFEDMGDFSWGLSQVVRVQAKGIFKGRGPGLFAPGAKITHQEAAVATLRLMDKEATAQTLSAAEAETMLQNIPDHNQIAPWAKASVAMLVKLGVIPGDKAFNPETDATRLDVAVMLVKALGYQADADAKMSVALPFQDAADIPANLVGYVAAAVDHEIITGVIQGNGRFFFPNHPVKRIEMAVMMGRADRQIDRHRQDELKGTITAVNAAANSFTASVQGRSVTIVLADEAAVFVDDKEGALADLKVNMKVEAKLDANGKAIYVEAKTGDTQSQVEGAITALTAATTTAKAKVSIDGVVYELAANAVLTLDSQAATFAGLQVGDTVRATILNGLVVRLEAYRNSTAVSGTIQGLTAATISALATVKINDVSYSLSPTAVITLGAAPANFDSLRVGDTVQATVVSNQIVRLETQRTMTSVTGTVVSWTAATQSQAATITLSQTANNQTTVTAYTLESNAEVKVNNTAATLANLQAGDSVTLTLASGLVSKVAVTRQQVTVNGSIAGLTAAVAASGSTPATPARIMVGYINNGSVSFSTYDLASSTQILINGEAKAFADLQVGDSAQLTLENSVLSKVEVTR